MIMLGFFIKITGIVSNEAVRVTLFRIFPEKVANLNFKAYKKGYYHIRVK